MHLCDEKGEHGSEWYEKFDFVARPYWIPSLASRSIWLPGGPSGHVWPRNSDTLLAVGDRRHLCSFSGSVDPYRDPKGSLRAGRQDLIRVLSSPDGKQLGCVVAAVSEFGGKMGGVEYGALMRETKLALVPAGHR